MGSGEPAGDWHDAEVVEVDRLADAISRVVLASPHAGRAAPGTHVDVQVPLTAGPAVRSYSIAEARDGQLVLGVLRSPVSRGGSTAMHALTVGDRLRITAPRQGFPLRAGAPGYVVLAGGIGITAVKAIAERLRRRGDDYRLVYVGRDRSAMAFLSELEADHGDRLDAHVRAEGTPLDIGALLDGLDPGVELYMCGPIRLMEAVRREWVRRELPLGRLRYETFGNSGWFAPEPFVVTVPRLGLRAIVEPEVSMLEALERAGADMLADCRKGECGLCEVRVLSLDGTIDHRDVFYSERQKDSSGRLCCCVSRVVAGAGGAPGSVAIEIS